MKRRYEKVALTIPLRPDLATHTLGEALDGELGGVVVGTAGVAHEAAHTGDLDDDAALLARGRGVRAGPGVVLAHDAHGVQGEVGDAPEVGLEETAGLGVLVGRGRESGLGVAVETVASVVDWGGMC